MHVYSFFFYLRHFQVSHIFASLVLACTTALGRAFSESGLTLCLSAGWGWTHFSSIFFFCYYSRVVVTHHDYIRHFRSNRSRSKISQNHYEFTNFTFSLSRKSHVLFPFDLRGCTTPTNYHDFDDRSNPSCLHGPAELHTNPQKRVTALPHTFIIHRAWTRKKRN